MNLPDIVKNLYTNKKADWILALDDDELNSNGINAFVINRWLMQNDRIRVQVRWLDKYVFYLNTKMFISLAWSVLPKVDKPPYVQWIKKSEEEEEFDFIIPKIRKHLGLSDNDFRSIKKRLIADIKANMIDYFSFYGVEKQYWKKYLLDFNKIKEYNKDEVKETRGLAAWGI
jgi:hypothetical protein